MLRALVEAVVRIDFGRNVIQRQVNSKRTPVSRNSD